MGELERALRNQERAAHDFICPREPQFTLLYEYIGDSARQDEIRKAYPNVRHCKFLMNDAKACEGIEVNGKIQTCPNNPFERESKLAEELQEQRPLLEWAEYVSSLSELHLLSGADGLSPEEFQTACIMHRYRRAKEMHEQARRIAIALQGQGE